MAFAKFEGNRFRIDGEIMRKSCDPGLFDSEYSLGHITHGE